MAGWEYDDVEMITESEETVGDPYLHPFYQGQKTNRVRTVLKPSPNLVFFHRVTKGSNTLLFCGYYV
jgi:hypothetical protein